MMMMVEKKEKSYKYIALGQYPNHIY